MLNTEIPGEVLEFLFVVLLLIVILFFMFNLLRKRKEQKFKCEGKRRKHGLGIGVNNPTVCYMERSSIEPKDRSFMEKIRERFIGF